MKRVHWLLAVLLLSVFGYVYVKSIPFSDFIKSRDNRMLVEGSAELLDTIEIAEYPMIPADNLEMTTYELVTDVDISEGVTLHYNMRDRKNIESKIFYILDETVDMWKPIGGELNNGILSFEIFDTGFYTVGGRQDVGLINFSNDLEEILSYAPDKTVGFLVSLGYRTEDMHDTLLDDDLFVGGCGGEFQTGDVYDASRVEKPASVFVNGVQTDVTFIYIVQWLVGEGCEEGENLESQNEI